MKIGTQTWMLILTATTALVLTWIGFPFGVQVITSGSPDVVGTSFWIKTTFLGNILVDFGTHGYNASTPAWVMAYTLNFVFAFVVFYLIFIRLKAGKKKMKKVANG